MVSHVPSSWHSLVARHVAAVPVQVDCTHLSESVHGFPSVHAAPSRAVCVHPVVELQASNVQRLKSSQPSALPPTQAPAAEQVSLKVQASPSLQAVPVVTGACAQAWVDVSQLSVVQTLLSLQSLPTVATHWPAVHALAAEQAFPSSHTVPSVTDACVHPDAALHASVVHGLLSLQLTAAPA